MTYIYVTTSYKKSRILMQQIREKIAIEVPSHSIYEVKYNNNRIDIHQQVPGAGTVCFRSYLVLIIPVVVNFESLQGFGRDVYFDCEDLINELNCAIKKLRIMKSQHIGRENNNATFEQLARSLHDISTEHGTSKDIRQVERVLSTGLSPEEESSSVPWEN
jgi:hypothetical protein